MSAGPRFTSGQVRLFAASTLKRVGGQSAWALLVPALRVAVADQTVLGVLRGLERDIPPESIDALRASVLAELGLDDV